MLFLFRGHYGPAVRAIAGALLLVAGIAPGNAGNRVPAGGDPDPRRADGYA